MPVPKYTPEQEDFFQFVKEQTSNPRDFLKLTQYALFSANCALLAEPHQLKKQLKEKILKGAKEHGSPVYSLSKIKQEFNDECIDLIGWLLVEKWNQKRGGKSHGTF